MKKILKSKRGIAIESALLFMMVIISISILLTSVIMTAHTGVQISKKEVETRLKLEQLGDSFVLSDTTPESEGLDELKSNLDTYVSEISAGITATLSDDGTTLTVKNKDGKTLLYIEKSGNQVITWRYSDKTNSQE